jgi:DNA-binding transcriptional ArsR family regulator
MTGRTDVTKDDLNIIRAELASMNDKLERLVRLDGVHHSEGCGPAGLVEHLNDSIDLDLERRMVSPCDCRPSCKALFTDILQRSSRMVGDMSVEEQRIIALRQELEKARVTAPYKKCSMCFDEVLHIFNGHVRMIRSRNTFVTEQNMQSLIARMNEKRLSQCLVDPVSNPQRLGIMKHMAESPCTYSSLSSLTGLKGGNLLFHLHKLSDSGMIHQDPGLGHYTLTDKGSKVLRYLVLMALELGEEEWI